MYLVSDSRPSEDDVSKLSSVLKSKRLGVLSKRAAAKLRRLQDDLVNNYTYTKEDIERNLHERKKSGKAAKNLGLEQTKLDTAVQGALSAVEDAKRRLDDAKRASLEYTGDHALEISKLEDEESNAQDALADANAELEKRKAEQQRVEEIVGNRKRKLTKRKKDVNWAKVNQRNKTMNATADFEAFQEQQARLEAEQKAGGTPKFNPYARRKVKPKMLWEVGQKEEKKDDEPKEAEQQAQLDQENGKQHENAIKAAEEARKAALVTQSHQVMFEEEDLTIDTGLPSAKKRKLSRARKGLSLAQYQERKSSGTLL